MNDELTKQMQEIEADAQRRQEEADQQYAQHNLEGWRADVSTEETVLQTEREQREQAREAARKAAKPLEVIKLEGKA